MKTPSIPPSYCLLFVLGYLFAGFVPLHPQQKAYNQTDLLLLQDDIHIYAARRGKGFDLYIRKKPAIESVQLFIQDRGGALPALTGEEETAGKDALELYNRDYGGQAWLLMDTSTDHTEFLGEAFYIYIPPEVQVNPEPPEGPMVTIPVEEGFVFVLRAFSMQYANTLSHYQDSPLIVRTHQAALAGSPLKHTESRPLYPHALLFRPGLTFFNPGPGGKLTDDLKLQMRLEPIGTLSFTQELSQTLQYEVLIDRDPLLMNRLIAKGIFKTGLFTIEAGPFIGILNIDTSRLNPGITASVKAVIPPLDIFTASIRFDTSLAKYLSGNGAYLQEFQALNFTYLCTPYLTLALTITNREFIRRAETNTAFNNGWVRYNLSGLYSARRFTAGLNLGYQELRWNYTTFWDANYRYFNIYAAPEGSYLLLPNLELTLSLELPLYPMSYFIDPAEPFLFSASLGVRWTF